jgi:GTPase
MFDRPSAGNRAILVQLDFGERDFDERLDEFHMLAESAGAVPLAVIRGKRGSPDPKTFAGRGKVVEIGQAVQAEEADIVIP